MDETKELEEYQEFLGWTNSTHEKILNKHTGCAVRKILRNSSRTFPLNRIPSSSLPPSESGKKSAYIRKVLIQPKVEVFW